MKPVCAVDGCGREVRCRGWCDAHYTRWLRYGDVLADEPVGSPRSGTRQWMGHYGIRRAPRAPKHFDPIDTGEL